jgi:hypothetical protein
MNTNMFDKKQPLIATLARTTMTGIDSPPEAVPINASKAVGFDVPAGA